MSRVELSKPQRNYILERDNYHCQFPIRFSDTTYKPSRITENLQVHHIVPYRHAQVYLGWSDEQINAPENLITLSEKYHIGIVHPDILIAKERYRNGEKNAFNECFAFRRKLTEHGMPYWFPMYDEVFKRIAYERTHRMQEAGRIYPIKLRRLANNNTSLRSYQNHG